ncbi:uncharacterized protein LOC115774775 [Archocentrus centrarchus]|uniref:uncharacterized protein LOC115774775 n=1 Tax=Archocentrus centrarchus TaxID=63155 RepID=UPI0011EA10CD|nr:uncharacterized protein LOC115774775 [Archocentrus centrarchus]
MPGEMGEEVCMHLKLPLVTPESLEKVIGPCVQDISHKEWMSLDGCENGSEVGILLFDMCRALIGEISTLVLEDVEPQVLASDHYHLCGDDETVQGGCSHCRVTEQDIQACFRNSLHRYFSEALNIAEQSSHSLDHLVRLFSAQITKSVNSSLAQLTWSALPSDIYSSPSAECILQMVHIIGKMFKSMLDGRERMEDGSCDKVACPRCNCEECWCADPEDAEHVEQHSTEMLGLSDCSSESSDCMEDLDPEPAPQHSDHSESHHFTSASSHPPCPEYLINGTFVTVVLAKLVDHIAANTRSSILNVDLDQLVYGVTRRTEGMLTFALPQRVQSLHISIYKKLCQIFGSKYVLQALMEAGDEEFELEVSKTLISVLKKSKTSKNTFNPGTLSPVPESQTPEPDGEEWSGKASPVPEIETPEPDGEEWSGKASPVPEIETPEPDGEEWSGKASPVPEGETPEPDGEEWSGKASPVPEGETPEPDGEEWSGKASPVPEGETPEPDGEDWSGKASLVPENQTSEAQREEKREQTSPSRPKRSLGRTIRKKLSRWASRVVNFFNDGLDSEIHRLDFSVTSPVWTNPLL